MFYGQLILVSAVGCAVYSLDCQYRHLSWQQKLNNAAQWPQTTGALIGNPGLNSRSLKYGKYYWVKEKAPWGLIIDLRLIFCQPHAVIK